MGREEEVIIKSTKTANLMAVTGALFILRFT